MLTPRLGEKQESATVEPSPPIVKKLLGKMPTHKVSMNNSPSMTPNEMLAFNDTVSNIKSSKVVDADVFPSMEASCR